jgi:hypothetical protein
MSTTRVASLNERLQNYSYEFLANKYAADIICIKIAANCRQFAIICAI